jgi:hypothetical protein
MRHASTAMSCVADENATSSANPATHVVRRVAHRDEQEPGDDAALREQHPAAALPERAADERQPQPIDDGRPQELERVREADPGEHADGRPVDAALAQPRRQGAEHQHERQAGREPEREH